MSANTIADRYLDSESNRLLVLIQTAVKGETPRARARAQRDAVLTAERVRRAARDVERQRAYERAFEGFARVLTPSRPDYVSLHRRAGQPGEWTGD